jgi:glucokinase
MAKYAIGVDLGATNIRVALGDDRGKIWVRLKEKTIRKGSREAIAEQILRMIGSLSRHLKFKEIKGVGLASVGPLDREKKAIINTPNLPFKAIFLKKLRKLEKPVFLLNDGQAGALGEKHFGEGKRTDNLVYVTLSSGIGGGAIVDGHLLSGEGGNAVEIGHFIVDTKYDLACSCGKGKGHWEAYASGENIPFFFRTWLDKEKLEADFDASSAKNIFQAAKKENKIAQRFIEEIGRINAKAFSNLIVAYEPALITLGGSVALNNPHLIIRPIKRYVDRFLKTPKIKISSLGEDIVLYGALAAAFSGEGTRI